MAPKPSHIICNKTTPGFEMSFLQIYMKHKHFNNSGSHLLDCPVSNHSQDLSQENLRLQIVPDISRVLWYSSPGIWLSQSRSVLPGARPPWSPPGVPQSLIPDDNPLSQTGLLSFKTGLLSLPISQRPINTTAETQWPEPLLLIHCTKLSKENINPLTVDV